MQHSKLEHLLGSLDVTVDAVSIQEIEHAQRWVIEPREMPMIHYVFRGGGKLCIGPSDITQVFRDYLIFVPRGTIQVIEALDALVEDTGEPGDIEPLRIISVHLSTANGAAVGVFDGLTQPIVEAMSDAPDVRGSFLRLADEQSNSEFGSRALVNLLVTQCLILMVRQLANRDENSVAYFGALADPRIAAALALIAHSADGSPSVGAMAEVAGMTKAAFAKTFTALLRQSPNDFVSRARLHKAARLLETTPLPIKAVAWSVGFASRSHFSRAFKAAYGTDPSAYRRSGVQHEESSEPPPVPVSAFPGNSAADRSGNSDSLPFRLAALHNAQDFNYDRSDADRGGARRAAGRA